MRLANTALAVACLAFSTVVHAQQFSIVSGDLHAQATVTGVPPVKDMPADVILGPAQGAGFGPGAGECAIAGDGRRLVLFQWRGIAQQRELFDRRAFHGKQRRCGQADWNGFGKL